MGRGRNKPASYYYNKQFFKTAPKLIAAPFVLLFAPLYFFYFLFDIKPNKRRNKKWF